MTALSLLCFSGLQAIPEVLTQAVLSPVPVQNYVPAVIVNHTTEPVYLVLTTLDSNGIPCFLRPSSSTGICSYEYPHADGTNGSVENSVLLSNLPQASGTGLNPAYLIYIPVNSSARSYFSIGKPMHLSTTYSPAKALIAINSPAPNSLNDPNIWTPYQDFEFGFGISDTDSSTSVYMNMSYVDYFCIPYRLSAKSYQGLAIDPPIAGYASGMPAGSTQTSVLTAVNNVLNPLVNTQYPYQDTWGSLPFQFYPNPYTSSAGGGTVRLLAAKNSTALGRTFSGGIPTINSFPSDYLTNASVGPSDSGIYYMQNLYNYYLASNSNAYSPLWTVITPAAGLVEYKVYSDPNTPGQLNFEAYETDGVTRNSANDTNVNLYTIALGDFLSGNITFANGFTNANPIGAELGKLLSALFDIEQLPLMVATTNLKPFYNAFDYKALGVNHGGYTDISYFPNPASNGAQPAYNLYDQALHLQELGAGTLPNNPLLGVGYCFDYDDLLGMDGTISGLPIQDKYGNPSQVPGAANPYVVMVLGAMNGTIPDLTDPYYYSVTIGPAADGAQVVFTYNGGSTTATATGTTAIPGQIFGGTPITGGSSDYLHATFTFNGINYVFNINLLGQVVIPTTGGTNSGTYPTFSAADQAFQSNFTFTVTSPGHAGTSIDPIPITLQFNSSPPGWEG